MAHSNGISMATGRVAAAMNPMAHAGELLASDWHATGAELQGLVGQLGHGPLGEAFLAGYRQPATEAATAIDECCRISARLAEWGNQCVAAYQSADETSSDALRAVGEAAPPRNPLP